MIEVGSLAAVETTLREHGFFGGGAEGESSRTSISAMGCRARCDGGEPAPPEPCPLPLAAVDIRQVASCYKEEPGGTFRVGPGGRRGGEEYAAAVEAVRRRSPAATSIR